MEMTKQLYETIRDLVELASDGAEARKRDAQTYEDRFAAVQASNTVAVGEFIVEEYAERYQYGDLK